MARRSGVSETRISSSTALIAARSRLRVLVAEDLALRAAALDDQVILADGRLIHGDGEPKGENGAPRHCNRLSAACWHPDWRGCFGPSRIMPAETATRTTAGIVSLARILRLPRSFISPATWDQHSDPTRSRTRRVAYPSADMVSIIN